MNHQIMKTGIPSFLEDKNLRLLMFGGKGGVGKTTCAAATAQHLSQSYPLGSFLLVSTDPAHSLRDVMAGCPSPANLKIIELNTQECLERFKSEHCQHLREIAERGTFLDNEDINQLLDLSLPGLDELLAFLEISKWVEERTYNCIVVDTAPTGHTLRLLNMPEFICKWLETLDAMLAKYRYMKQMFSGVYRQDELDKFLTNLTERVEKMAVLLRAPAYSRFVPVTIAEPMSIQETVGLILELENLKIPVTEIVVNQLYPENNCPVCSNWRAHQRAELVRLLGKLSGYIIWGVPLYSEEVCHPEALEGFWKNVTDLNSKSWEKSETKNNLSIRVESSLVTPSPQTSLLIFAGKGGVGKTTLACATALQMAQDLPGQEVFLFSTDPAHSLSSCLEFPVGPSPKRICAGLTAMEIDAQAEFDSLKTHYQEELNRFLQSILPNLDLKFDREVMERIMDLSPPGIDEVMALTRAIEFLAGSNYDILILDSAPTGHLIRLLELPEIIDQWLKVFFSLFLKYKRIFRLPEISKILIQMSKDLKILRSIMLDPNRSALYAITILTEMAFQETIDLIAACRRLNINVPVLLLNLATPESNCPFCSVLYRREREIMDKVRKTFSGLEQPVIYRQGEIHGLEKLGKLGRSLYKSKIEKPHNDYKVKHQANGITELFNGAR
jgi:arsenite-transporting ATPase